VTVCKHPILCKAVGSATYGRPFFDHTSFPGWLRAFLPRADPTRKWEVINAGAISYASYRIKGLMAELSRFEPDLFIVYTGENEFLERRTYASAFNTPELRAQRRRAGQPVANHCPHRASPRVDRAAQPR